jgi:hypothetical protein
MAFFFGVACVYRHREYQGAVMKLWVTLVVGVVGCVGSIAFAAEISKGGAEPSLVGLVMKDLVGAPVNGVAYPKRWPDGPLRVDVLTVDVLNEPVAREALRKAFEETVAGRLDYLNKETGLSLQSTVAPKGSGATLSIIRIPFIPTMVKSEPFWSVTICNLLKEHGVEELCDPGKPLEDMGTVNPVENASAKTTADKGVCVILEDPLAGCEQHVLDDSIRTGATMQDLCIARFHTQWSTGEFSGSQEAYNIYRSFAACSFPIDKPPRDANAPLQYWKRQIDTCSLLMLGFSGKSLVAQGWPRLASTGCSLDEACNARTSKPVDALACTPLGPASWAHTRALRYVYSMPMGAGVDIKSMRTFVNR